MLSFLPPVVLGAIAATLLAINTLFWCLLLFVFALVKLVLPFKPVRALIDSVLNAIATSWIACNSGWMWVTQRTEWDVEGLAGLEYRGWYMVNCNHQSWVDIFVLQHLLNRRVPLLKFFLKRELIYVPVLGLAWWALDFPFMQRHSDAELRANPEKRFEDLETSRRACQKFALVPTSVMNFPEGTRFTPARHATQRSPYRHLLKPRAGAMALALSVLGERFRSFVDVTIVYPGGAPTFWEFLCARVPKVIVRVRRLEIPAEFTAGDYATEPRFRKTVQRWQQEQWRQKDAQIDALLEPADQRTDHQADHQTDRDRMALPGDAVMSSSNTGSSNSHSSNPDGKAWLILASVVAVVFGLMTIRAGGTVLFGGEEARRAAGAWVGFVVWFNFLAGFAYIVAGTGLWARRRWAALLAFLIAAGTLVTFAAFGIHVATGGAYEMRTVAALSLRSLVWLLISAAAWRWIWRRA